MTTLTNKTRLFSWLVVVLVVGFLTTSLTSYIVSRNSIRQRIVEEALPLTGDNIYSEIQKDLLRPVFISSLMAQDTFVRDWILAGEKDDDPIVRYLSEVKVRYGTITSFLVSDRSRRYYHAEGILKTVLETEPRDAWFFRVRKMTEDYETNVDPDMANLDTMTVFINYRVLDYSGNFIGAIGVGSTLDTMAKLLDQYQDRFQRTIYFLDERGAIALAGKSMRQTKGSIRNLPGIGDIADALLNHNTKPSGYEYRLNGKTMLVNSRFIPELHWYLVVEQDVSSEIKSVERVFLINLVISAAITLLVLSIMLYTVNRYQQRLERMATIDDLTGLLNRQAFEAVFQETLQDVARTGKPLSVILLDIDSFKQINDNYGHLAGDQVIHAVAELARIAVRQNDIVVRWGGEEFLVVLRDCPMEAARRVAEDLRGTVLAHDFDLKPSSTHVTVSLGVAQFKPGESPAALFKRADAALYDAKASGRNCVGVSDDFTAE
jgi:diguanylate cyclase (GGDEF)-like protein